MKELNHNPVGRSSMDSGGGVGRSVIGCWGLAVVACLLLTCEAPLSERFVPVLYVHGLVFAPRDNPRVLVNRTYAIDEEFEIDFRDAEVLMCRGRDSWVLDHRGNSHYIYGDYDTVAIRPFDTVALRVTKPGFAPLDARTMVPDTFSILSPAPADTVKIGDSLVWSRSRNCKGYYTMFKRVQMGDTYFIAIPIPNESLPGLPYDSAVVRIPLFFLNGEPEGQFTLYLLACDTNYYDWIEDFGRGQPGSDSAHISGGVGVFGSAAECSVQVYIRQDSTGMHVSKRKKSQRHCGVQDPLKLESRYLHFKQQVIEPGFWPVRMPGDQ